MRCLILVDLQYDFMPGGPLAVSEGDKVVPMANQLMPHFDLVAATQDWHPADHMSFASNHSGKMAGELIELDGLEQVLWPDHCIEGSRGAALHEDLDANRIDHVIRKGTDSKMDSYSGFFDNGQRQATGLDRLLKNKGVTEVAVMGLATDYCVKFTALDAIQLGFTTSLIEDGCRGVDLKSGDVDRAITEMTHAGVAIVSAKRIRNEYTEADSAETKSRVEK